MSSCGIAHSYWEDPGSHMSWCGCNIISFTELINSYFLSIYYVPSIILGTRDAKEQTPCSWKLTFTWTHTCMCKAHQQIQPCKHNRILRKAQWSRESMGDCLEHGHWGTSELTAAWTHILLHSFQKSQDNFSSRIFQNRWTYIHEGKRVKAATS